MNGKTLISITLVILGLMCTAVVAGASSNPLDPHSDPAVPQGAGDSPMVAAGSGFTYQGRLNNSGNPANGQYDFVFKLYDALSAGNLAAPAITVTNQTVTDGLFTTPLDFGAGAFNGAARWLDIATRPAGNGSYTPLTPRQPLSAAPYALSLMPGASITSTLSAPLITLSNTVGAGIYAQSATNNAVTGIANSLYGNGVYAENLAGGYALTARNNSTDPTVGAIFAQNTVTTGGTAVYGQSYGYGLVGYSFGSGPDAAGVYGFGNNNGVEGHSSSSTASGVYAENYSGGFGLKAKNNTTSIVTAAVYGENISTGAGVFGSGGTGVFGSGSNKGVYGSGTTYGVYGTSSSASQGAAVYGTGPGNGVEGHSTNGVASGVYGENFSGGYGVAGRASGTGTAVYGDNWGGTAGHFRGNVSVQGTLSKGGGSFKIDDPIDPANKYLYHSFVESPDMKNIYDGNVTTDSKGEATVTMPAWFEALNQDFRYQLTVVGQFAQAIVSSKMKGNSFSIKTDKPNVEVSWQVTGTRHDPFANAHRIPVEENKSADDKGKYLYPIEQGKPESQGIGYEQSQQMARAASTPPQTPAPAAQEHGR